MSGTVWVLKVRERTVSGSDRTLFEGGERATEEQWKVEMEGGWGQRWLLGEELSLIRRDVGVQGRKRTVLGAPPE